MMPSCTPPVLAIRLDAGARPWRLPRETDMQLELINLALARNPGDPGVPLAFAAMPGRYLLELLSLGQAWQGERDLLILNPAWDVPPDGLRVLLAELAEDGNKPGGAGRHRILHSFAGEVLAYVFPPGCRLSPAARRALRDLSCFDATLDVALLRALGLDCVMQRVRLPAGLALSPALASFPTLPALACHVAQARIGSLEAGRQDTWAVMTHHAGDLFLALKVIQAIPGCIQGVITHADYADIVREVLPGIPLHLVHGPMPARAAAWSRAHPLNDELLYFERHVLPALPADRAICMLRPIRGYKDAGTTFAAQLAFVLGDAASMEQFSQVAALPYGTPLSTPGLRLPRVRGKRVLLHFDGGWPLKIYPARDQQALIDGLQATGYTVSVLGATHGDRQGVRTHAFTSLADLRHLLSCHDVLIGMDSFPCHYAALQMGLPTLCLFGPTSLAHLAHDAPDYLALSRGLPCSPCDSYNWCPAFGGPACHNFVDFETVIRVLARCLEIQ